METVIFAPNRQYKSKNLRGLLAYARRSAPYFVSIEVNRDPATGAPYLLTVEYADGAKGLSHWHDWRVCADWIAARRSWHGPAIHPDCRHGDFIARLRGHYLRHDGRYSVRREFTGAENPQYVARFCGEWIGADPTETGAWILALQYDDNREHGA